MAIIPDVKVSAIQDFDTKEQIESLVRQLNEWARQISNEDITLVKRGDDGKIRLIQGKLPYENGYGSLYYDTTETPRIIIGIDPDGETHIHVSDPGVDVTTLF